MSMAAIVDFWLLRGIPTIFGHGDYAKINQLDTRDFHANNIYPHLYPLCNDTVAKSPDYIKYPSNE